MSRSYRIYKFIWTVYKSPHVSSTLEFLRMFRNKWGLSFSLVHWSLSLPWMHSLSVVLLKGLNGNGEDWRSPDLTCTHSLSFFFFLLYRFILPFFMTWPSLPSSWNGDTRPDVYLASLRSRQDNEFPLTSSTSEKRRGSCNLGPFIPRTDRTGHFVGILCYGISRDETTKPTLSDFYFG